MKKNLLFIVPTLCGGGAEKTVANLSLYLKDDYNVYIAVFRDTKVKYKSGGKILFLGKGRNAGLVRKCLFFIRALIQLRRIKRDYRISWSISFLTPADFMNVLTRRKESKTIVSIRNTDSVLMSNFFLKKMTRFSCLHADKVISISRQVKDDLATNFGINPDKITTIYNPSINIPFNNSQSLSRKANVDNFTFLNIGRLVDQKGQWHLIRSFNYVVRSRKNARLILLGQGPNEKYLRELIRDYHLESRVSMLGFVDNPYDYMARSDCFVFSSLYEGLGNVLLESLACGLPIISTDCVSGPREILDPHSKYSNKIRDSIDYGEYGVLCPVFDGIKRGADVGLTKDEKIYSEAMIDVMDNKAKLNHYKKQALIRSKDFSIENIIRQWKDVLC